MARAPFGIAAPGLLLAFADLVADHRANCRAAEHANRAAQQHCAADCANSGTRCRVSLPRIHVCATNQAEQ